MDKVINNNGFDYVDLGLPSGTLWATMNVGASSPSDFGFYFQWGDTIGYTEDQLGFGEGKKKFIWGDYKWSINGSDSNFSKYKDRGIALDLEDDAAHVHMGGDWHIPTPFQIQELIDNTIAVRTKLDDVSGVNLTSKKDKSKSIFIPSTGFAWYGSIFDMDGAVYNNEGDGNIWSSMTSIEHINCGHYLGFDSVYVSLSSGERSVGMSVRGVITVHFGLQRMLVPISLRTLDYISNGVIHKDTPTNRLEKTNNSIGLIINGIQEEMVKTLQSTQPRVQR